MTMPVEDAHKAINETLTTAPSLRVARQGDENTWTIELPPNIEAPDTTISEHPVNPTTERSASFSFTGSDDRTAGADLAFECRLDSDAPADLRSCTSPHSYAHQGLGPHTVEVRAIDGAASSDPTPGEALATYTDSNHDLLIHDSVEAAVVSSRDSTAERRAPTTHQISLSLST
jgi:hypothetical protein